MCRGAGSSAAPPDRHASSMHHADCRIASCTLHGTGLWTSHEAARATRADCESHSALLRFEGCVRSTACNAASSGRQHAGTGRAITSEHGHRIVDRQRWRAAGGTDGVERHRLRVLRTVVDTAGATRFQGVRPVRQLGRPAVCGRRIFPGSGAGARVASSFEMLDAFRHRPTSLSCRAARAAHRQRTGGRPGHHCREGRKRWTL